MAEAFVELGAEAINHVTDRYYDRGYDRFRKYVNGKKVESVYEDYEPERDSRDRDVRKSSGDAAQDSSSQQAPREVRSSGGGPRSATVTSAAGQSSRRRKQQNRSPSPKRDIAIPTAAGLGAAAYTYASSVEPRTRSLERQSITNDRVLREYESERDDPPCRPEKVLSPKQLSRVPTTASRRNQGSSMTSQYGDGYRESRPRSQPAQSRYGDDDGYGSDYDDRTGQRYRSNGRGYDDRDYDVVREETERYRGPAVNRPTEPDRRGSYRSGYDDEYPSGALSRYDSRRRSGEDVRDRDTYVSHRDRRDHDRDRDSRSRSSSRDREGPLARIGDNFDTGAKGLGAAVAGAVIGGLAGRHFGKEHRERDMLIAGAVGAAVANIGYKKVHEHREREREDERYDDRLAPYGSGGSRSRSSIR